MAFTQAFGTFFAGALKQLYSSTNVEDLTMQDNVLYAVMPKVSGFGGESQPLIMQYANTQAVNNSLATAQTLSDVASPESIGKFTLTRVRKYGVARLEQEGIEATATDKMAFLQLLKTRLDGLFQTFANRMETALFRSHNGEICQIASAPDGATVTVTLTQIEEITNIEIGMYLIAATDQGGQTVHAATNGSAGSAATVTGVNRALGTFTFAPGGGNTDWAASDYIFVSGDQPTGATHASATSISGLSSWIPAAAPGTNAWEQALFFGVTRTADSRLYGQVHDGSAESIEEALIKAQSKAAREGGAPELALMINAQYRKLILELGTKRVISEVNARSPQGLATRLGFRAVEVEGDAGVIKVAAARRCQATTAWLIKPSDWKLMYLGSEPIGFIPYPELGGSSALKMLRLASDDGVEARVAFRGNVGCLAPNRQIRVTLATP